MNTKHITAANAENKIRQLYEMAFPEDEQIPWDDLMRLVGEMPLDFTAYYDGEDFIGFTIVYPRNSFNRRTKQGQSGNSTDERSKGRAELVLAMPCKEEEDRRSTGSGTLLCKRNCEAKAMVSRSSLI